MKLILTKEEEMVLFLDYLYKEGRISHYFNDSLALSEEESDRYLLFLADTPTEAVQETSTNSYKKWTTDERTTVYDLIRQLEHPSDIADRLGRTEASVRDFARNKLNLTYSTKEGRWKDKNFD